MNIALWLERTASTAGTKPALFSGEKAVGDYAAFFRDAAALAASLRAMGIAPGDRVASVGRAQSAVEVAIGDEAGNLLPTGAAGEIMVRGLPVMRGYWNNPEATRKTVRDGWLMTGDIGALDADGYLTLQDRSKDVIISGGTNIYPREVEEVLLTHPAIREVSVVGAPSAEWGEDVVAFVVLAPGSVLDPAALSQHCVSEIARFKRPKFYHAIEEMPKNNYGKVLKTELREMAKTLATRAVSP